MELVQFVVVVSIGVLRVCSGGRRRCCALVHQEGTVGVRVRVARRVSYKYTHTHFCEGMAFIVEVSLCQLRHVQDTEISRAL